METRARNAPARDVIFLPAKHVVQIGEIFFAPRVGTQADNAVGSRIMWQNCRNCASNFGSSVYFRPGDIMTNSSLAVVVAALARMAGVAVAAPALAKSPKHVRYIASLPVVVVRR